MVTKAPSIKDSLRKRGYSEKTIEKILKWYDPPTKKGPKEHLNTCYETPVSHKLNRRRNHEHRSAELS